VRLVADERDRALLAVVQDIEHRRGRLPCLERSALLGLRPAGEVVEQLGRLPGAREAARENDIHVLHEPAQTAEPRTRSGGSRRP
jgi:hypothetical protein